MSVCMCVCLSVCLSVRLYLSVLTTLEMCSSWRSIFLSVCQFVSVPDHKYRTNASHGEPIYFPAFVGIQCVYVLICVAGYIPMPQPATLWPSSQSLLHVWMSCFLLCCSTNLEPYIIPTAIRVSPSLDSFKRHLKITTLPHHNSHHLATTPHL